MDFIARRAFPRTIHRVFTCPDIRKTEQKIKIMLLFDIKFITQQFLILKNHITLHLPDRLT